MLSIGNINRKRQHPFPVDREQTRFGTISVYRPEFRRSRVGRSWLAPAVMEGLSGVTAIDSQPGGVSVQFLRDHIVLVDESRGRQAQSEISSVIYVFIQARRPARYLHDSSILTIDRFD